MKEKPPPSEMSVDSEKTTTTVVDQEVTPDTPQVGATVEVTMTEAEPHEESYDSSATRFQKRYFPSNRDPKQASASDPTVEEAEGEEEMSPETFNKYLEERHELARVSRKTYRDEVIQQKQADKAMLEIRKQKLKARYVANKYKNPSLNDVPVGTPQPPVKGKKPKSVLTTAAKSRASSLSLAGRQRTTRTKKPTLKQGTSSAPNEEKSVDMDKSEEDDEPWFNQTDADNNNNNIRNQEMVRPECES